MVAKNHREGFMGGIWFIGDRTDCNALRSSDDSTVLVYENDGMDNVWLRQKRRHLIFRWS